MMFFYAVFVLLASCMLQAQCMLLSYHDFIDQIRDRCYGTARLHSSESLAVYGQVHPLANSMENFLSFVERLEKNGTMGTASSTQDAAGLANALLRRFSIEGVIDVDRPLANNFEQTQKGQTVNSLLRGIQNSVTSEMPNIDNVQQTLNDDEWCSMYFMLSHSINKTHRQDDGPDYLLNAVPTLQRSLPQTNRPREQGVVSLHRDQTTAISLAPVLAGIAFAGGNYPNITVRDLVQRIKGNIDQNVLNQVSTNITNPLYAATIAGIAGYNAVNLKEGQVQPELSGIWNSSLCTTDYRLNTPNANVTDITLSVLRGAVDGMLLGFYGRRFIGTRLSLSNILRSYYSMRGLPVENSVNLRLSFCNRVELYRQWKESQGDDFRRQVQAYAEAYVTSVSTYVSDTNVLRKNVDTAIMQMDTFVSSSEFQLTQDESDFCQPLATSTKINESPADVFIVMESDQMLNEEQQQIIAALGNLLDLRFSRMKDTARHSADGGSVSLFTNKLDVTTKQLRIIVYDSNNPSCPGCRLAYQDYTMGAGLGVPDAEVISRLTDMLVDFKNNRSQWTTAPSKVVIYFKSGNLNVRNSRDLDNAVREFRMKLPEVRFVGVGSRKEALSQIVRSISEDVVVPRTPPAPRGTAEDIKSKINEVPAQVQYPDCRIRPSHEESSDGFITPGYYQYWAMYPEYFLKSFNIQFTFSTGSNSRMTVCYSRATSRPEQDRRNCNVTSDAGGSVAFRVRDPCRKQTVYNCAPLYFAIYGGDINKPLQTIDSNADARCDEIGCNAPDQIKFTVQHTGVSCNGALCLLSSPLQLFLTTLLVLCNILKSKI